MKKSLVILLAVLFFGNCVLAKDYAKLHIKEMKNAQKYSTTKKYFEEPEKKVDKTIKNTAATKIKDPKLLVFGNQEKIDEKEYDKKLSQDEDKYSEIEKTLKIKSYSDYSVKSRGENFYQLYRIAERIIRANNLDFINWRIGLYKDSLSPNAYSANTNYIAISTSLYDTFLNNDDAIAYLYASYANEQLYRTKNSKKALEEAKECINTAYKIEPDNKYIKEQMEQLNNI